MVNQQLLDFIKQQSSKGVDRDTIVKELSSGGWTIKDIQEGFNSINAPVINPANTPIVNPMINPIVSSHINNHVITTNTSHSGKKILIFLIILFLLAGIASGYYFRNDIPIIKDLIKSKVVPVSEIKQEDLAIKEESKLDTKTDGSTDCGKDMTCFMNAVTTCSRAFVEQTTELNIFGMYNQTNKTKITLTGYDSSKKCGYLSNVITATIDYSPEVKSSPEYKAGTEEQKKEGLVEINDSIKSTIGMTTKCTFTTSYLTELLTKWAKGTYSSEDMGPGNCTTTDINGKVIPMLTGSSGDSTQSGTTDGSTTYSYSSENRPSNEIDLYLNKQTIFSDKSISSSDLGLTLLEVKENPSDSMGNDKIFKISVKKISTGESKILNYSDGSSTMKKEDHVFGVVIRNTGFSHISGLLNNGVDETKASFQITKE